MKDEHKILSASIVFAILFVIIDSVIDPKFVSGEVSFLTMVITAGSWHEFFMRAMVVIVTIFLGYISSRLIARRRHAEEKLAVNVAQLTEALAKIETLSGLLPICSYCKKIRDDKGYWNKIETYISGHSKAEFTHSICPDCGKKAVEAFRRGNSNTH